MSTDVAGEAVALREASMAVTGGNALGYNMMEAQNE
jgi:hypothetical protein